MRDWASHTPYSDPGRHRQLLRELPDQVEAICVAARNVIDRSAARTRRLVADGGRSLAALSRG